MENTKAILVVEDSDADYEAVIRAFKKSNISNPLYRCASGEDALAYLRQEKKYAGKVEAPRPGIILLDLNLPGLDGRSLLKKIKSDPHLQTIPVVILTTSNSDLDIDECYKSGANSYITKPIEWTQFLESVSSFKAFWLQTATLPEGEISTST